jgi:hypothetical protein
MPCGGYPCVSNRHGEIHDRFVLKGWNSLNRNAGAQGSQDVATPCLETA